MAWNPATLTGTVKDSTNTPVTASGYIWFTLSQNGNSVSGGSQIARNAAAVFAMTNGVIAGSSLITANDDISPAGTYYIEEVLSNDGGLIVRRNVTINGPGTSVNIGTLPTPALPSGALPTTGTVTATTGVTSGTQQASRFIGPATGLRSATTDIDVAAAAAPSAGQVLTAASGTAAAWQSPASGVPTTRLINAGNGLSGGGDLSADRTLALAALTSDWTAGTKNVDSKNSLRRFNVVTGYGADNTGTNDASTAIQNAVNAAAAIQGGIVYCPPGTYKVGTAIAVPNFVWIVGDGDRTVFNAPGNNYLFSLNGMNRGGFEKFTIQATSAQTSGGGFNFASAGGGNVFRDIFIGNNLYIVFDMTGGGNCLFDNIRQQGSAGVTTVWNIAPAASTLVSDVYIRNCVIVSGASPKIVDCVKMSTAAAGSNIDSVYIVDGAFANGTNCLTTAGTNRMTGGRLFNVIFDTLSGVGVQMDNVKDWHMIGCALNTLSSNTNPAVQIGANAIGVDISHNTIQNCGFTAVDVAAGAKLIRVAGNTIADDNTGNNANGDGIRIGAANTDFEIYGNTVSNNVVLASGHLKTGINILAGASDYYDIIGNTLTGLETAALTDSGTGTHKLVVNRNRGVLGLSIVGNLAVSSGSLSVASGTNLTLANGANQNVALGSGSLFVINGPTAAFSIGGLTGGQDGRIITLVSNVAQTMTLNNQDAGSTTGNKIWNKGGANWVGAAATLYQTVTLMWNTPFNGWNIIGAN